MRRKPPWKHGRRKSINAKTWLPKAGSLGNRGRGPENKMEADRDEYYKQFISLTYDYSAAEVEARDGYILHGTHRDDIPIETKTVTSSEFKTYNSNGNTIHIPAEAKPAEMMKRRRKALRRMYPALKPPQPTGSMRMLWLRTLNRRCCLSF